MYLQFLLLVATVSGVVFLLVKCYLYSVELEALEAHRIHSGRLDPGGRVHDWVTADHPDVLRGLEVMGETRIAFVGIIRDAADILPINLLRLKWLASHFAAAEIFVYENDSRDSTPEILATADSVSFLCESGISTTPPIDLGRESGGRFTAMAAARQKTLEWVRSRGGSDTFDYVAMVDLDLVGGFSLRGMATTFAAEQEWDAVFANGLAFEVNVETYWKRNGPKTYDVLAFQLPDGSRITGKDPTGHAPRLLPEWPRIEPHNHEWVTVSSAFGGLGIYRAAILDETSYPDGTVEPVEDCEHVLLHERLRQRGWDRFFINPRMIVLR